MQIVQTTLLLIITKFILIVDLFAMQQPATRIHESHESLATRLRLILSKASKTVERIDKDSIASTGLCLSDFQVLEVLLHKGPMPVNSIGRRVLLTSGSISTAVQRLEKRGMVRRKTSEIDRRVQIIDLQPTGKKFISTAFNNHSRNLGSAMKHMTPTELLNLNFLLKKLGKGIQPPSPIPQIKITPTPNLNNPKPQ